MSEGTRARGAAAVSRFLAGGMPMREDLAEGVWDLMREGHRMRAILHRLARGGFGEGASIDTLTSPEEGVSSRLIVCCGSRDEGELGRAIAGALAATAAFAAAKAPESSPPAWGPGALVAHEAEVEGLRAELAEARRELAEERGRVAERDLALELIAHRASQVEPRAPRPVPTHALSAPLARRAVAAVAELLQRHREALSGPGTPSSR